jgi:RND family efflux transporter MFP subunit
LPEVLVGLPLVREVTDYETFTGRTEASERAEIRSRVTGYLEKTYFTEGAAVQQGQVLFLIDPRPYDAELTRAKASLAQAQARFTRLQRDYERFQPLVNTKAVSREEFDKIIGDRDEAQAAVGVAEANVKLAQLNLTYTEIRAPFSGLMSRQMVDPGNLVKADETVLSTLVATDPMYVYFDVDERTLLGRLLKEERLEAAQRDRIPIEIGLADEESFPHAGVINFVDNRVDPNTGSMWLRGEFVNPARAIKPGIFVRVRLPLGKPYQAVIVAEQALGTDQGQRFLYVVDAQNKAAYRAVKVGQLSEGLRVVREGLNPGEKVVVSGLQRVRAGAEIVPKLVDMMSRVAASPGSVEPPRSAAEGSPARPAGAGS